MPSASGSYVTDPSQVNPGHVTALCQQVSEVATAGERERGRQERVRAGRSSGSTVPAPHTALGSVSSAAQRGVCLPVIPALRVLRQGDQELSLQLHQEFEASVGYMKLCPRRVRGCGGRGEREGNKGERRGLSDRHLAVDCCDL